MSATRRPDERSAVELAEEALALLRRTPAALAWHWAGLVPFWLAVLWYWTDMTHGALARQRCSVGALAVAVLYLWKRAAQSRAGAWVRSAAVDAAPARWTGRDWLAMAGLHAGYSTWSLLAAVPMALAVAPLGWWLAWHESLTAVCDRPAHDAGDAPRRAWASARADPAQNHMALGIFSIAAPLMAVNLAIVFAVLPGLAQALLGVRWPYAMADGWMLRGLFAWVVLAATHLLLDPPLKAMYALRAFYLEARRTGADLRAEWRRCRASALTLALALVCVSATARAEPEPPSGAEIEQFNAAADRVLARPEFAWRLPRNAEPEQGPPASMLERAMRWIGRQFAAIGRWLRRLLDRLEAWLRRRELDALDHAAHERSTDWVRPAAWAVTLLVSALLAIGLIRAARHRAAAAPRSPAAAAATALDSDTILATSQSSGEWIRLARELVAVGDHRRAVRALFLAMLADLAAAGWIEVRPARTNRDYRRDLERSAAVPEPVRQQFARWTAVFERCWYGAHSVDSRTVDDMISEWEAWHDVRT